MIYDYTIIGGGIAGIAIAEALSRNSDKVILIEKEKELMSKSSSDQHGWFHIGSLYAFLDNNNYLKGLIKNTKDIITYYSHFENLNMHLDKNGFLKFKKKKNGWFQTKDVKYLIASRNNKDLEDKHVFKKIKNIFAWEKKIKKFISRHNTLRTHNLNKHESPTTISNSNYFNYNKKRILKPNFNNLFINKDEFFLMNGFDKPMRSKLIYADLLESFYFNGGKCLLSYTFSKIIEKKNYCELNFKNKKEKIFSKKVIFANGTGLKKLVKDISIYESPLMVTYPKIFNKNIVKLTPNNNNTINHFLHESENDFYSVIGSGLSCKLGDNKDKARVLKIFKNTCRLFFKNFDKMDFKKIYFGKKVEFTKKTKRNYGFKIFELSKKSVAVLPGKFSMSFNLATNIYRRFNNQQDPPLLKLKKNSILSKDISNTRHYKMVKKYKNKIL